MDARTKLAELRELVESARSMPMSASCVVNRSDLLATLAEVEKQLPLQLAEADRIQRDRDQVLDDARVEARRMVEEARQEQHRLIHQTDVYAEAKQAADKLTSESREQAAQLRRETDDYVDHKLASFEVALSKTMATVNHASQQLAGGGAAAAAASVGGRGGPQGAQADLDRYAGETLRQLDSALRKTLETVSRGRVRLQERSELDRYDGDAADQDAARSGSLFG